MTATATDTIRARREQLGISRLRLAVLAEVSTSRLAELEGGYVGRSAVLDRVLETLGRLEGQALAGQWELTPGEGRSAYRGDTDRPAAA